MSSLQRGWEKGKNLVNQIKGRKKMWRVLFYQNFTIFVRKLNAQFFCIYIILVQKKQLAKKTVDEIGYRFHFNNQLHKTQKNNHKVHGRGGIILFNQHFLDKNFCNWYGCQIYLCKSSTILSSKILVKSTPEKNEESFRMTFFHYLKVCSLRQMVVNWEKKERKEYCLGKEKQEKLDLKGNLQYGTRRHIQKIYIWKHR